MLRPTSHALVLLSLCLVAACRIVTNADYCDSDQECRGTPGHEKWVCDTAVHACKEPSVGEECQDDSECGLDAPICGEVNTCRLCQVNSECENRNSEEPICNVDTGQCTNGCMTSADCDGVTPICNGAGECESCNGNDAACDELAMGTPYCATEGDSAGACVVCLDNAQCTAAETPICGDDNACRSCQEHDECGSTVCDRVTGACVAESAVAYVVSGGAGDCTKEAPCGTIAAGLEFVRANNEARYIVRLDDGTYTEPVSLGDITVRIIGDGATVQLDGATPDTAVFALAVNANVTLEGLTIRGASNGANADGIRCEGGGTSSVEVLQSIITENGDLGIDVFRCILTVRRSAITNNVGGGIQVNTAPFDITNSYILDNGDVRDSVVAGVRIANAQTFSPQRFAFNTVADNEGSAGADAGGVFCDINATSSAIITSNVIMEGFGGRPAVGGDCTWVYSNIEDKADIPGAIAADETNIDANCMLTDRPDGLQAIEATSSCANAGQDDTGILVDYDGATRPATDPDMGADEL